MSSDTKQDLARFAKLLMSLVRDQAINACDRLAMGAIRGPDGERWRSLVADDEIRNAVEALIPDIVDQTLFELLNAADNGAFPLGWRLIDGSLVDLDEIGKSEMAGWLMGSPGWRHEYSSQRYFDPLADLELDLGPDHPTDGG